MPAPVETLGQLFAQAVAMQGNNLMGGRMPYSNDIPEAPFVPQLPQGWQPPGQAPLTGVGPSGETMPTGQPMQMGPIPRFYIPPGYHLRSREGNIT